VKKNGGKTLTLVDEGRFLELGFQSAKVKLNREKIMSSEAKLQLSASDAILARIIQAIPEPAIASTQEVFHDLMSCIIEQQIHYRSTKRIFLRMLQAASLDTLTLDNFPAFEEISLSEAKLSLEKYEAVLRVLDYWQANPIHWQFLSDDEVREKLAAIKGIGPWTIDMILLYNLQRPGIFPVEDFHLKQIMVTVYGLNPAAQLKAQMLAVAKEWGEHTSLAVKYLLAWKEQNKKLVKDYTL
jgi:DNA-3-methyladenine glycosylase II